MSLLTVASDLVILASNRYGSAGVDLLLGAVEFTAQAIRAQMQDAYDDDDEVAYQVFLPGGGEHSGLIHDTAEEAYEAMARAGASGPEGPCRA